LKYFFPPYSVKKQHVWASIKPSLADASDGLWAVGDSLGSPSGFSATGVDRQGRARSRPRTGNRFLILKSGSRNIGIVQERTNRLKIWKHTRTHKNVGGVEVQHVQLQDMCSYCLGGGWYETLVKTVPPLQVGAPSQGRRMVVYVHDPKRWLNSSGPKQATTELFKSDIWLLPFFFNCSSLMGIWSWRLERKKHNGRPQQRRQKKKKAATHPLQHRGGGAGGDRGPGPELRRIAVPMPRVGCGVSAPDGGSEGAVAGAASGGGGRGTRGPVAGRGTDGTNSVRLPHRHFQGLPRNPGPSGGLKKLVAGKNLLVCLPHPPEGPLPHPCHIGGVVGTHRRVANWLTASSWVGSPHAGGGKTSV